MPASLARRMMPKNTTPEPPSVAPPPATIRPALDTHRRARPREDAESGARPGQCSRTDPCRLALLTPPPRTRVLPRPRRCSPSASVASPPPRLSSPARRRHNHTRCLGAAPPPSPSPVRLAIPAAATPEASSGGRDGGDSDGDGRLRQAAGCGPRRACPLPAASPTSPPPPRLDDPPAGGERPRSGCGPRRRPRLPQDPDGRGARRGGRRRPCFRGWLATPARSGAGTNDEGIATLCRRLVSGLDRGARRRRHRALPPLAELRRPGHRDGQDGDAVHCLGDDYPFYFRASRPPTSR